MSRFHSTTRTGSFLASNHGITSGNILLRRRCRSPPLGPVNALLSFLADRTALTLFNRRQLTSSDFRTEESGAGLLKDDARN